MSRTKDDFRIGLAGLGTVGSGLAQVLNDNSEWIAARVGRKVVLSVVADREEALRTQVEAMGARFMTDARALSTAEDVDVVVELIGGTTVAKDIIADALAAGKHVVTANKALLAEHGTQLFTLATEKGVHLGYEASVAGGIPILQAIKETLGANRIQSFMGIVNGTCNFILTEMTRTGMDFEQALRLAQEKGFAEADPALDIEGWDSAHKLTLLIMLCFGRHYALDKLPVYGVDIVTKQDIAFAQELGYSIKLLATARQVDGKIEGGVFPALIEEDSLLAKVEGSFNAVRLEGNAGPIVLYGHGAGDRPTGSAVLGDIMTAARGVPPNNTGFADATFPPADILDLDDAASAHYLRFRVPDKPGVLRDIAGAMADRDVSLAQVIQKDKDDTGEGVPIVFLTHDAPARAVHEAMQATMDMGLALERPMHLRIV